MLEQLVDSLLHVQREVKRRSPLSFADDLGNVAAEKVRPSVFQRLFCNRLCWRSASEKVLHQAVEAHEVGALVLQVLDLSRVLCVHQLFLEVSVGSDVEAAQPQVNCSLFREPLPVFVLLRGFLLRLSFALFLFLSCSVFVSCSFLLVLRLIFIVFLFLFLFLFSFLLSWICLFFLFFRSRRRGWLDPWLVKEGA